MRTTGARSRHAIVSSRLSEAGARPAPQGGVGGVAEVEVLWKTGEMQAAAKRIRSQFCIPILAKMSSPARVMGLSAQKNCPAKTEVALDCQVSDHFADLYRVMHRNDAIWWIEGRAFRVRGGTGSISWIAEDVTGWALANERRERLIPVSEVVRRVRLARSSKEAGRTLWAFAAGLRSPWWDGCPDLARPKAKPIRVPVRSDKESQSRSQCAPQGEPLLTQGEWFDSDFLELKPSPGLFEELFDVAPLPVAVQRPDGTFIFANDAFEALLGYSRGELRQVTLEQILWPEDRAKTGEALDRVGSGSGKKFRAEVRLQHKGGRMIQAELAAVSNLDQAQHRFLMVERRDELKSAVVCLEETNDIGRPGQGEGSNVGPVPLSGSESEERKRIGLELHDGLAQHLTGVAFKAKELEEELTEAGLPQAEHAKTIVGLVNDAICQIRRFARGLGPLELEATDLTEVLQNLSADVERLYQVECSFHRGRLEWPISRQVAQELFRISQEAVRNAIVHGCAGRIQISLEQNRGAVELRITDDGKGFEVKQRQQAGVGLGSMHLRARSSGGKLRIQSAPGRGTVVHCRVPFK